MASTDSVEDNTGFAQKNGATFPILADPSKIASRAYGVLMPIGFARRWTFYIDPEGKIAKIDKEVNPATAGADLVDHLETLGAPRTPPDRTTKITPEAAGAPAPPNVVL